MRHRQPPHDIEAGGIFRARRTQEFAPCRYAREQVLNPNGCAGRNGAWPLAHQLAMLATLRAEAESGTGVVLLLHDLTLAINHAQRVLVLREGRLLADGPPQHALSSEVISEGWNVQARWLGEPGARALAVS